MRAPAVSSNQICATSRRGLAVRELLLIVAILTVAFGVIVSLARRVRSEAAYSLVQRELLELEDALAAYRRQFHQLPEVPPLVTPVAVATPGAAAASAPASAPAVQAMKLGPDDEASLRERAIIQNRALVRALGVGARGGGADSSPLGAVSAQMFDGSLLLDPWGGPIAYLTSGLPQIGTATGDAPFFFSAGPDGLFLTRDDNVYSYEVLAADRLLDAPAPNPVAGEGAGEPGAAERGSP